MRLKLSQLSCLILLGASVSTYAHSNSLVVGEIGGIPTNVHLNGNGQPVSQDSCETIAESVNQSLMERWKAVLPKNEHDNVSTAVKQSEAVSINNNTSSASTFSIRDLFNNPFEYLKKSAQRLYETAQQKAQEFLKNSYAKAIESVTKYVNNMYAEQLAKYAEKMGGVGGRILTGSLGQFVPKITSHLSNCAKDASSACLMQTLDHISLSAGEAATRVLNNEQP